MSARMKVFVINLDRSPDRLARIQIQSDQLGFDFERVRAVDGRTMSEPFLGNTFDDLLTRRNRLLRVAPALLSKNN
jgi:glycosyl transferase, family 25